VFANLLKSANILTNVVEFSAKLKRTVGFKLRSFRPGRRACSPPNIRAYGAVLRASRRRRQPVGLRRRPNTTGNSRMCSSSVGCPWSLQILFSRPREAAFLSSYRCEVYDALGRFSTKLLPLQPNELG